MPCCGRVRVDARCCRCGSETTGTVTFLFTDIVDSVELWERAPDAMADAFEHQHLVVRDEVECHAGHIFSTGDDAFCAVISRADEAVAAAVDEQGRLQGLGGAGFRGAGGAEGIPCRPGG